MKKRVDIMKLFVFLGMFVIVSGLASAAVGIYITQESVIGVPGETVCLNYGAYNPWPEDSTIEVSVSEELEDLFVSSDWENNRRLIEGNTASGEAVPVELCFVVPEDAYADDRKCESGEVKEYDGTVFLTELNEGGAGSAAQAAVTGSAKIRAQCVPTTRNFTIVLIVSAIVLAIIIIVLFFKKIRMGKEASDLQVPSGTGQIKKSL